MNTSNLTFLAIKVRLKTSERREAFTLIELFVALSILFTLASLLLPGLAQARARARSIVCVNHLKQLQLGWRLYAEDNQDRLVPNLNSITLFYGVEYSESLNGSWVLGNAQTDTTAENIEKGLLFPYMQSALLYSCPSDSSTISGRKGIPRTRSYSMNCYLSSAQACTPLPSAENGEASMLRFDKRREIEPLAMLSQLSTPASVFVFLDVNERSIDSGGFNLYPALEAWDHLPADRHNQGCNLSFADGHVERYRWRNPKIFHSAPQPIANESELIDFKRLAAGIPVHP